jgi:ABC-type glycerol-3-phosphate transport system permease component
MLGAASSAAVGREAIDSVAVTEAGKIDGAGSFGSYWRIVFPLSISGFVVVVISVIPGRSFIGGHLAGSVKG